jgi:lysozyme
LIPSADLLAFLRAWEGLRLKAYDDGGGVWTIGYGHTKDVRKGDTCTREQAEKWLAEEVSEFATGVDAVIHVATEQHEFDACVSLAYNIGLAAFRDSTLLRKLNENLFESAKEQFGRWVFDNGKRIAGLVSRRAAEREMFDVGDYSGRPGVRKSTQPVEQISESAQPVAEIATNEAKPATEKPVGPFLAFLPSILQMIPQLASVFRPGDENIAKGVEAAKIVTNVLTQSTGAVNLQDAVEKMQADPTVARSAAAAVLTQPEISVLIVEHGGGGVTGARDFLSANASNPQMVSIIRTVSYWALAFLTFANVAGFALASFLIYKDRDEWQQIVSTLIQADIAATMIALGFWLGATMAKSSATGNSQR